jgi:hypothetical protein
MHPVHAVDALQQPGPGHLWTRVLWNGEREHLEICMRQTAVWVLLHRRQGRHDPKTGGKFRTQRPGELVAGVLSGTGLLHTSTPPYKPEEQAPCLDAQAF